MIRKGFTLMELLVVVAIMGLLGTISVGGYRAMQRGMEERGVMQNVNEFLRAAYQRAQIDRQPVAVWFWNETMREEDDIGSSTPIVVGKAVAVRRSGRITRVDGEDLCDEFGDLRFSRLVVDEDDESRNRSASASGSSSDGVYLYPMNGTRDGTSFQRTLVSANTVRKTINPSLALARDNQRAEIEVYAYHVIDRGGVNWNVGDAYGFEFAELQLPHNFIFGSSFSSSIQTPVVEAGKKLYTVGGSGGGGVQISSLRPGSGGELSAQSVGTSSSPDRQQE